MVALGSATANGQTIFAKNSDRPADECQPLVQHARQNHEPGTVTHCQFVDLPEAPVTYRHIGSRPYWCWGYEHGFNEHQVVIGNEAVFSVLPESGEPRLVGMEILRLGLERSRTASEAVGVMTDVIKRYGQGVFANDAGVVTYDNGYIVADPQEAYVIETAGHEWAVKPVERAIGISNIHSIDTDWSALSPAAETYASEQGWWQQGSVRFDFAAAYAAPHDRARAIPRCARSNDLLRQHDGSITASTMMAILSDHAAGPLAGASFEPTIHPGRASICIHRALDESGGNTAASLVADLCADGSRLPIYWCSLYSPCLSLFLPIFIDGELPEALSIGGAAPAPASPWWQFRALSRAVYADLDRRVAIARERWAPLQKRLLGTAYAHAREGRRLLDAGLRGEAVRLLTSYMAENSAAMLATIAELLDEFGERSLTEMA
jgi:dipeptidase